MWYNFWVGIFARATLFWGLGICLGCEPAQQTTPVKSEPATVLADEPAEIQSRTATQSAKPFEHEQDLEYQNGLANLLSMSPVFGVRLVTSAFRIGYLVGLDEAETFQFFTDGAVAALGCVDGYGAIDGYPTSTGRPDGAAIKALCINKRTETSPQGTLFSEWRLKQAQWAGANLHDVQEIDLLLTIYVVGYNMGFAHRWQMVDHEKHVEEVTNDACQVILRKAQPPLSSSQMVAASSKCQDKARSTSQQFGHQFRCLLAGKDMNGDLSGQATLVGCSP